MTKHEVDLDDALLDEAQKLTGEDTVSGAITVALEQLVRQHAAAEYIEALRSGLSQDLDDAEVIRSAQR